MFFDGSEQQKILKNMKNYFYPTPVNKKEKEIFLNNLNFVNIMKIYKPEEFVNAIRKSKYKKINVLLDTELERINDGYYKKYSRKKSDAKKLKV